MSRLHWFALSLTPGIGGSTARRLVEKFGSAEDVFAASDGELREVPRVTEAIVAALRALNLDDLERQMDALADNNVSLLTLDEADERYPPNLRACADAPGILYCAGDLLESDSVAVAVVGTREPSAQSERTAFELASELAERGVTVVSGLARGIDTAAHRGAMSADSGRTIGVIGSGLKRIHPRENASFAREMAERGAVLSELAPDIPPQGMHLMARDRIISGLSRAVVVVEAVEGSGSLDTAARAKKQGRPVYAVPGSAGCDALLRRGSAEICEPKPDFLDKLTEVAATPPAEKDDAESGPNGQLTASASEDVPSQLKLFDN
ncbi:MAG: DNA-protecting protein DprA [Armatimonadetes bacterium]|nr:DNA-protecting protein DprA [Armatimonadota bacterium]